MPGCVLRAAGARFDVKAFLATSPWSPAAVFLKGARRTEKTAYTTSGFNLVVSDASGDRFDVQVAEATTFLRANRRELKRLRTALSDEPIDLDFGVLHRGQKCAESFRFAAEFSKLAGNLDVTLVVSIYLGR